ncbi:MAG: FIST C-terminal domain-containing protein [Campylobacterota bacterium]|nr:FIST C-terminal domain-containing protein [Campylobacterota bacterium]
MKATYFKSFEEFLESSNLQEKLCLLFVAEKCNFKHEEIKSLNIRCYGAIFPEIIYERNHYQDGLIAINIDEEPILIEDIQKQVEEEEKLSFVESMLVIVDGLSPYIDPFLVSLFEATSEECKIFGGGAGKLTLKQERVVFTPQKITQDSALIIPLEKDLEIGVSHGWEFLEGPFVATANDKNILEQINYQCAFDIYKDIVEKDCGIELTEDNFFDLAKSYPIGIVSYSGEVIVRDPIATIDGSLVLVGSMPENSVIQILKGTQDKLIAASKTAAISAIKSQKEKRVTIMIDCISRVLFLEKDFKKEIDLVAETTKITPLIGALTLGEIANTSDKYIDFYNKTCVVSTL